MFDTIFQPNVLHRYTNSLNLIDCSDFAVTAVLIIHTLKSFTFTTKSGSLCLIVAPACFIAGITQKRVWRKI
jgi:hypothetical protein